MMQTFELIQAKTVPVNRYQKRIMTFEFEKLRNIFYQVENEFSSRVMNEDNNYNALYHFYLDQFTKNVTYVNEVIKPKYWHIDPLYFVKCFRPLEKFDC